MEAGYGAAIDAETTGLFAEVFEEFALSFSCKRANQSDTAWEFLWTFDHAPAKQEIRRRFSILSDMTGLPEAAFAPAKLEPLEDCDWLAASYRALPPFTIGNFFVYGSHYDGDFPQDGRIPLLIEASTAFGSGEHGTTSCCLLAIEHVKQSGFIPRQILDMGCGSGILAVAAAKLWPALPVFAADNDPASVRLSRQHAALNQTGNVRAFQSEGYNEGEEVWNHAPYDFIIANILAGPLIDMAAEQSRALREGGYLILSGTLQKQAQEVVAAYTPHGLQLVKELPGNEWITLLLRKGAA